MTKWFAVYTKPRKETLAEEHLQCQKFETYLPRILKLSRNRGHWYEKVEPLFPRYIFVYLKEGRDNFAPIRSTCGVVDFVRFGGIPKSVPLELIEGIRIREDPKQGLLIGRPHWRPGMELEILKGPFAGMSGIFETEDAEERVVVLLRLLGRDNKVMIAQNVVVPA